MDKNPAPTPAQLANSNQPKAKPAPAPSVELPSEEERVDVSSINPRQQFSKMIGDVLKKNAIDVGGRTNVYDVESYATVQDAKNAGGVKTEEVNLVIDNKNRVTGINPSKTIAAADIETHFSNRYWDEVVDEVKHRFMVLDHTLIEALSGGAVQSAQVRVFVYHKVGDAFEFKAVKNKPYNEVAEKATEVMPGRNAAIYFGLLRAKQNIVLQ